MNYFRSLFLTALLAGLAGGILSSAANITLTVPLILKAEVFEREADHKAEALTSSSEQHDHEHEAPAEARDLLTLIATLLAYIGFALLLTVSADMLGMMNDWRSGFVGGLAGFVVFSLLPALGLPPELPGMPAAALEARQLWWLGTAASAAAAIVISVRFKRMEAYAVGLLFVFLPFALGAPVAPKVATPVPRELYREFVLHTLVVSLMSWALVGLCVGWLRSRSGFERPRAATFY
ncbi:CbtA family protein [Rhizobium sp. AB2/73]|uniref:CbtA family protein n=1 Tax=Rhizobium sp. AB2/73 TaxID=2795216 RepID=UPI000DDE377A|nr:CbtA family protein [Rhizobium sp. AB2/73]